MKSGLFSLEIFTMVGQYLYLSQGLLIFKEEGQQIDTSYESNTCIWSRCPAHSHPTIFHFLLVFQIFFQWLQFYFRKQMSLQTHNPTFQCILCYPTSPETVSLMYNLRSLIVKQHQKLSNINSRKLNQTEEPDPEAVTNLLRFVFNLQTVSPAPCQHAIASEFLLLKTGLNVHQLSLACTSLYNFAARRSYQLQVLTTQIKCFPKSIAEEVIRERKQTQVKQAKIEPTVKVEAVSGSEREKESQEGQRERESGSAEQEPCYYYPYYFQAMAHPGYIGWSNQFV